MPDTRIHVDFNGLQEDGRISALRRHADDPSLVNAGSEVQLWDEDGNTALGRVTELGDRGLVHIEVVPGSWQPENAGFISIIAMEGEAADEPRRFVDHLAVGHGPWRGDYRGLFDAGWWTDDRPSVRLVVAYWMTSPSPATAWASLSGWGRVPCTFSFSGSSASTADASESQAGRTSLRIAR